jgi:hypothetical protein
LIAKIYHKDDKIVKRIINPYLTKKKTIIDLYLEESFFHTFLNNFQRKINDPLISFYCQPFVKDLFEKIKNKYETQQKEKKLTKGTFYRGGLMKET